MNVEKYLMFKKQNETKQENQLDRRLKVSIHK